MARIIGRTTGEAAPGSAVRDWRASAARVDKAAAARSQAATILLNARSQARAIIAAAQVDAAVAAEEMRRQAREAGYQEGLAGGQHDVAMVVEHLAGLARNAAQSHETSARGLDQDVLTLVMAVAGAVVRQEIEAAPEVILSTARAALHEMALETVVQFRVHPQDEALLREHLPTLGLAATVQVSVSADARIERGGCLVETASGQVDARLETQLGRIESMLRERLDAA